MDPIQARVSFLGDYTHHNVSCHSRNHHCKEKELERDHMARFPDLVETVSTGIVAREITQVSRS